MLLLLLLLLVYKVSFVNVNFKKQGETPICLEPKSLNIFFRKTISTFKYS